MLIKYNTNNIQRERRFLNVISKEISSHGGYLFLTLTTETPHNLHIGDIIVFHLDIVKVESFNELNEKLNVYKVEIVYLTNNTISNDTTYKQGYYCLKDNTIHQIEKDEVDVIFNKYNSQDDRLFVTDFNFSDTTFSVSFPKYKTNYIKKRYKIQTSSNTPNETPINENSNSEEYIIQLQEKLPATYQKDDEVLIKKETNEYTYLRPEKWDDPFYEVDKNPLGNKEYLGSNIVKFAGSVYYWQLTTETITCKVVNEFFLQTTNEGLTENMMIDIEDNRFVRDENTIRDDVSFYEYIESLKIILPISSNNATDLNDENINKFYFEEKKKELISEIVDNEKVCFLPYYYDTSLTSDVFVEKIRFNLFLRDRSGSDNWNTNDTKGWNQYLLTIDEVKDTVEDEDTNEVKDIVEDELPDEDTNEVKGTGEYKEKWSNGTQNTQGDLLGQVGFTDDDIYYRKKKVGKTFIRLLFYDSSDPFKQMLLFYSTIFLDSADLYDKYIRNISKKKPEAPSLVNNNNLGEDNLTLSFTVVDKYNTSKSSEGFYLYLYPEGLKNTESRTIYMKVEFNHAGYGQTIPLICPRKDKTPLSFKSEDFPTSLLNKYGLLNQFYEYLYIPITIKYDETCGEYKYKFDISNIESDEIIINLFEPRINSIE